MTHLCAVAHTRGHLDGCDDDTCAGCRAVLAADGLQVCGWHADRVHEALSGHQSLAALWDDVEDALTLRGRPAGARGSGRPLPVDLDSAGWRGRVRACLVSWCLVLEEDFDVRLDGADDTVAWMADRVSRHATRLLASEHADQLCADLLGWVETADDGATTRHDGLLHEGRRLAFKASSARRVTVQCPSCPKRVEFDPDAEWIACSCGEGGVPSWWVDQIAPKVDGPMCAPSLLTWLLENHRVRDLTETTLRKWVQRGTIVTAGRDDMGRTLYDPISVAAVVVARRARTA